MNQFKTEFDINNIDGKSPIEHQIQIQETKESVWVFDKINSMKIRFYKTCELSASSYVKLPLRSNAVINIGKNDKYCFLWSILASVHPCKNDIPKRISSFKQHFDKLNVHGFDCSNGFKCSDFH